MPVSTLRITFQDGTELDVRSSLEFVGLDEEGFRVAYDAFLKTQAELGGLKGPTPPLNSKFWRERVPAKAPAWFPEPGRVCSPRYLPRAAPCRASWRARLIDSINSASVSVASSVSSVRSFWWRTTLPSQISMVSEPSKHRLRCIPRISDLNVARPSFNKAPNRT